MTFFIGSILIVAIPILFAAIFFPDAPCLEVSYPLSPARRRLTDRPIDRLLQDAQRGNKCPSRPRLVLTLSTSAEDKLKATVTSLLQQSCPVDALYISVPGAARKSSVLQEVEMMSDIIIVNTYRSSHLLSTLQEERDPSTWIITVDDDVIYHKDMVLALVVAASHLPQNVAPGFWCAQSFVQFGSLRYSMLPAQSVEGTVLGWCYSFGGVLYRRSLFDDQVFLLDQAPNACLKYSDVWAGGHLLSKGDQEFYLVNPGFEIISGGKPKNMGRGLASDQAVICAQWFAVYWGVFAQERTNVYRHPHFQRREKDLKMLSMFRDVAPGTKGAFLESRALDGRSNSVSYFFEKELGWRGILVEPSDIYQSLATERNRSLVMQTAICGQDGTSRSWLEAFDGKSDVPGVTAFEDTLDKEFVRLMDFTQRVKRKTLQCQQLQDVLKQAAMPKLHFLALDSSWNAMDILSNFPFQEHQIDVIYLEVTRSKCRFLTHLTHPFRSWAWSCEKIFEKPLKAMLSASGYTLTETILVDIGGLPNLAQKQFFFHYAQDVIVGLFFRRIVDPEPKDLQDAHDGPEVNCPAHMNCEAPELVQPGFDQ